MNIYQIDKNLVNLLSLLDPENFTEEKYKDFLERWDVINVPPSYEEWVVGEYADIEKEIDELHISFDQQVEGMVKYIRDLELEKQKFDAEIQRLSKISNRLAKQYERVEGYLDSSIKKMVGDVSGYKKKFDTFEVSYRKSEQGKLLSPDLLPFELRHVNVKASDLSEKELQDLRIYFNEEAKGASFEVSNKPSLTELKKRRKSLDEEGQQKHLLTFRIEEVQNLQIK